MEISSLNTIGTISSLNGFNKQDAPIKGESFENMLSNALNEVNQKQIDGYEAMKGIATGEVLNLQEAVQKITKAESTLKLSLEVKNKALGSFKEIMRMQI